jgi:hypothetical protein
VGDERFVTIAVGSAGGGALDVLEDVAGSVDAIVVGADVGATFPVDVAGGATFGAGDDPPHPTNAPASETNGGAAIATEAAAKKRREEKFMTANRDTVRDRLWPATRASTPSRTSRIATKTGKFVRRVISAPPRRRSALTRNPSRANAGAMNEPRSPFALAALAALVSLVSVVSLGAIAGGVVACGKVKDPTPKGATLFEWDRSRARQYDTNAPDKPGPPHPLASATILEGPQAHAYRVTVTDPEGKFFSADVDIDAAKVSYRESPASSEDTRWATTKTAAKVAENGAFHVTGACDDVIATLLGAPNEVTNTVVTCRLTGKRPNSMGDTDAITIDALLQIEGSGKILESNDPMVKVQAR